VRGRSPTGCSPGLIRAQHRSQPCAAGSHCLTTRDQNNQFTLDPLGLHALAATTSAATQRKQVQHSSSTSRHSMLWPAQTPSCSRISTTAQPFLQQRPITRCGKPSGSRHSCQDCMSSRQRDASSVCKPSCKLQQVPNKLRC
jgi:hypothetical protein